MNNPKFHFLSPTAPFPGTAYALYEARGREDGHDLEDWLHAEEEITEKKVRPIAA